MTALPRTIDNWPVRYQDPESNIARLVQMPLYVIAGEALANAYMADFRVSRRITLDKEHGE